MKQKETPKSPMSGGKGAEVSKTLFYIVYNKFVASVRRHNICKANMVRFVKNVFFTLKSPFIPSAALRTAFLIFQMGPDIH